MNQKEFLHEVAHRSRVDQTKVGMVLENMLKIIIEELKKGERVRLTGFGDFSAKVRHARNGVNPQKPGESIQIPEVIVPKFKAGSWLKGDLKAK